MGETIGRAALEITADTKQFYTELKNAERASADFAKQCSSFARDIKGFGSSLSGVGEGLTMNLTAPLGILAGAFGALTGKAIEAGDEILNGANEAGLSIKSYQELGYALSQISSLSEGDVTRAFMTMTSTIGEAAKGSAKQVEALKELGYSEQQIASGTIDTEDAFNRLKGTLSGMQSPAQAMALTGDLMGEKVGRRLAEALRTSSGEVDTLRQRFRDLGLGMSDDAVKAAEDMGDQLDTTKRMVAEVGREIGTMFLPILRDQLIPAIQQNVVPLLREFAAKLQGLVTWFSQLSGPAQAAVLAVAGIAVALGPALVVIGQVATGIGGLISFMGGVPTVAGPLIAIVKGLATALLTNLGPALAIFAVGGAAYMLTRWLMDNTEWGQKLTGAIGDVINKIRGVDTAQLQKGVDVTKNWTDAERAAYDAAVKRAQAHRDTGLAATEAEAKSSPARKATLAEMQNIVDRLNARKTAGDTLSKAEQDQLRVYTAALKEAEGAAKRLSDAQVALFGTSKLAAQQAAKDFETLKLGMAAAGQTIETMTSTQLYNYLDQLNKLAGASAALPGVNAQIESSIQGVVLRLSDLGLQYSTIASTQSPALNLALQTTAGFYTDMNTSLNNLSTIETPALSAALQTLADTTTTTTGQMAIDFSSAKLSFDEVLGGILSGAQQIGGALQGMGGEWKAWGSVVADTAKAIVGQVQRIILAQQQYGKDSETTGKITTDAYLAMGQGTAQAIADSGTKYKSASIAAAVIAALLAAVRALSSAAPPYSYVLAALSLAAGMATVAKIKSAPAYSEGTPGLDFAGFSKAGTPALLHSQEAVIPRGKGHLLAGEIAAAMPEGSGGLLAEVRGLREDLRSLPETMNRAYRNAMLATA